MSIERCSQEFLQSVREVVKMMVLIWVNIKNRLIDGEIVPPFWIQDFFRDMYLKNLIIWNF